MHDLYPLILIVTFLTGTTAITTFVRGEGTLRRFLNDFMAAFFLAFAFFKLLDLQGFANAFQAYDIIARESRTWALAYPFIELALGLAFLARWNPMLTNSLTLVLMLLGSIGVVRALASDHPIACACLGTTMNLPMTAFSIAEDLGMAAMATAMLIWKR